MCSRAALAALAVALASCRNPQPCPTPLEECGGQCVDIQSDRRHCGVCDHACRTGETCAAGLCSQDALPPCPDRTGGAFVSFGACGGVVKLWVRQTDFLTEAVSYVGSTVVGRTPVLTVLAGTDCDAQWSWSVQDTTAQFASVVTVPGCDVCPAAIQANVAAFAISPGKWCPATARILAVDAR